MPVLHWQCEMIFWPRSHSVQLTYSVYKRENIHFIITCPSHWTESRGHSWQDYIQLKDTETVHLQLLWSCGFSSPKYTSLCCLWCHTLCPATQNVTHTSRPSLYYSPSMRLIFVFCFNFFYFQKPSAESISLSPLSSRHILFVANYRRALSKGSPTLSYWYMSITLLSPSLR